MDRKAEERFGGRPRGMWHPQRRWLDPMQLLLWVLAAAGVIGAVGEAPLSPPASRRQEKREVVVSWYRVALICPRCGQTHGVSSQYRIENGPTEAGTVAELYAGQELPAALRSLLRDKVWCDQVKEWVEIADPARVVLTPRGD